MWLIRVNGVVQGVGFRPNVKRAAMMLGTRGFVRNDGSHVTIGIEGDPDRFMNKVRALLGPMARIERISSVETGWEEAGYPPEGPEGFSIVRSTDGERDSPLPPDTAICGSCLEEMMDQEDRRFLHPFTNCTDCGARYTVMTSLPYDRENTTMRFFPMCRDCSGEYSDHGSRRFHAQTLSCPVSGPVYTFLNHDLEPVGRGWEAVLNCARGIKEGGNLIIRGWGGMHMVCDPATLPRFREWYGRPYKPFAVMVGDIGTAEKLAAITGEAREALISPARPIVLLEKRDDAPGWARDGLEHASPGLGTIGLYLPYSGINHLLFRALGKIGHEHNWMVMTSGNTPGEPMALDTGDVESLGADGYLVHNRKISARADDSVVVPHPPGSEGSLRGAGPFGMMAFPIRKSRGLVPDPLPMPHGRTILSLGAERNVSVTVSRKGRCFSSPYIGNTRHPSVLEYTRESARRLMYLFGAEEPECVAVDMHPRYQTRRLGGDMARELGIPLKEVQHHHAHAVSLMVDAGIGGLGAVAVDGVGYGADTTPWGGEVLIADTISYKRVGHLEPFGLPGGDASVYHPERIAYWLTRSSGHDLRLDDAKLMDILDRTGADSIRTTSLGRLLDALSALLLGVTWRTYDGEPALRLEPLLAEAREPSADLFSAECRGGIIPVLERWGTLVEHISDQAGGDLRPGVNVERGAAANLAKGLVDSIIRDMVGMAATGAMEAGHVAKGGEPLVGITGGVAYNVPIMETFLRSCREMGAVPVLHARVPPGDGGISVGQAVVAGSDME